MKKLTSRNRKEPLPHAAAATLIIKRHLRRRYLKEKIFRHFSQATVGFAFLFLLFLFSSLVVRSIPNFTTTEIKLTINYDRALLDTKQELGDDLLFLQGNVNALIAAGLRQALDSAGNNLGDANQPATAKKITASDKQAEQNALMTLVSGDAAFDIGQRATREHIAMGTKQDIEVLASGVVDEYAKGHLKGREQDFIQPRELHWLKILEDDGRLVRHFNWRFFKNGDSRAPETAGIANGLMGSFLTIALCFLFSFPIAVMAGVYLEEFFDRHHAPAWLRQVYYLIEININSLAAVPSIIYGLFGLFIIINFLGVPRSSALAGGLTLGLMTMPLLVIVTRTALRSVPKSIREAALSLGVSKPQLIFHHLLPLSLSSILTGTILGLSRALGETAPLIMIGMVAFIMGKVDSLTAPTTTLPVQVFLWATHAENAFIYKTAAAIIVLLFLLFLINLVTIIIRQKWSKQW